MAYIEKMVMQGFKSFAKKTEILFDREINLFVGPNGSGKTNVVEALCFVLGRLSAKSMRAAKSKNLIFMGSKYVKPAKEAFVELIFNNTKRDFSIDKDEVHLRRIVRNNGQSIYKINGETKTRAEVIETLAQAGIDPYGFNLIMQGQIQSIVRMHAEDRRKIIEEIAGISIYESRKEKSLRELGKTEERLKEISTILRERTAYLRNLENEKAQAQKYKDAELIVKRAKASLIQRKLKDKEKEVLSIIKSIEEKYKIKDKIKSRIEKIQNEINELGARINEINKSIQQASGIEQDNIHNEIANLKAELEGLKVRKESYENRKAEVERRIEEVLKSVPEIEEEIKNLRKKSPLMARKAEELKKKKQELSEIESERKKSLTLQAELESLKERINEKEGQVVRANAMTESLIKRMEEERIEYENEEKCLSVINNIKKEISGKKDELERLLGEKSNNERIESLSDLTIKDSETIKKKIEKIDICPLCQSKMSEEHINHVFEEMNKKIKKALENKERALSELENIKKEKERFVEQIKELEDNLTKTEAELITHKNIKEKKEQLKKFVEDEKILKEEIKILESRIKKLEYKTDDSNRIEERYEKKILEIEEISSRTEEDFDTTLLYKERELENVRNVIKRGKKDIEDIDGEIDEISNNIEDKVNMLEEKEEQEKELNEKFRKMFETRDKMQKLTQEKNINSNETQNEAREIEDQINYLKIGKAKLDAEHSVLEMEISEYKGIELLQGNIDIFEERLAKAQNIIQNIGAINMRALEVYDKVKGEYDKVQEKVNVLVKEKEDVLKIIEEIDRKKKKTFMKTFNAINDLFSDNFSKLSDKGIAYLEIENNEDIFSGGVNIIVKLAKGKYFDVTSLSGGEQTLVALSLLFAIQEHKPYHFYVLDEIDAALDKRNSERLASLLNQYMKSGQYIVVSHNDAIITNSNILYGVSMHEGVSKILSLKVN